MESEQKKQPPAQRKDETDPTQGDVTLSKNNESSDIGFKANGSLESDKDTPAKTVIPSAGENGGLIQSSCPPSDLKFEKAPVSKETERKIAEIQTCLTATPFSRSALQYLAKSEGGFVNDELRKAAWPKLLGVDAAEATPAPSQMELEAHQEYQQVVMDVNRSLKRFPPGIPYQQRVALQDQLTRLILRVIIKYPHLRYYQGYHDVAVTFLLVVGEDDAFQIMEKLSTEHLKDCMEPTMDKTSYLLNFIYPLIQRLNPSLYEYLERADVGTMFCLAWFLTWYGHSLNQYNDVVRLYDYFLASPPLMPLYLAAQLVVYRQDEIFAVECDMACIHDLLSKIPDDLPFELLLKQADALYKKYPPESIEREVRNRFDKELQMRRAGPPRRKPSPYWWRFVPRIRYRVLVITASAAIVGLYAYFRMAEAVAIEGTFPVR